ncbi:hypothetical protein FOBRF1_011622 [Fusarium oxysporum]
MARKKVPDASRRGDTNGITRDPVCRALLDQPVADFIYESYCQVQRLSLPGKAPEQDRALAEAFQGLNQVEEEHTWSDGCQYIEELDSLDSDRYVGSLRTAALSVSFARWHQCQVKWLENTTNMTSQSATNSVFERGLGTKPQEPGARQDEWKRRRQRSSTSCTRGKKWLRLLDAFDDGILFKVGLGKSRDTELDTLIIELTHQIQKVEVLGLLSEQIKFISNTGRTSPALFREQLVKRGYPDPYATSPTTGSNEVDAFVDEVRDSNTSGRLLIPRANFKFDIASLQRLAPTTWLNDDIVLACLHLSTRLPFVRIGFSVPMHRQTATRAGSLVPDPFQRASSVISGARASKTETLVWLFPLFQRNNHFSLLEINERDEKIYHYDSMTHGENTHIKTACNKAFSRFPYEEKRVMQQPDEDTYSCGALVIKNARDRMMGRLVAAQSSHTHDATELRMGALRILQSAWRDHALTVAPMEEEARKRKFNSSINSNTHKRQKTRETGKEYGLRLVTS